MKVFSILTVAAASTILASITLLTAPAPAHAGEPLFGYVYTTDTTPAGKWEIEQWVTAREGQAQGRFHHIHLATEFEYGVTDNFQVAVYAKFMYDDDSANSVRGFTEGIEIPYNHDKTRAYQAFRQDGTSIELLYRVLSPYKDPLGLAFYVEPEFGPREAGLELKAIFQKNFLDDQLVLALNTWIEFEYESGSNLSMPGEEAPNEIEQMTMAEADLGVSYRFAPNWFAGLEFRNHNEYGGFTMAHAYQEHTAFFGGPNIHYASQKWFFTLSALRQLGAVAYSDEQRAEMKSNKLYGDEHTAWDGIRLKVGFPL
jgi:hypothetical protein